MAKLARHYYVRLRVAEEGSRLWIKATNKETDMIVNYAQAIKKGIQGPELEELERRYQEHIYLTKRSMELSQ